MCHVEGGTSTEATGEVTVGCTGIGFDVSVANGVQSRVMYLYIV